MKNAEKLFDEGLNIVYECLGQDIISRDSFVRPITIDRAQHRWGRCRPLGNGKYEIGLSKIILSDETPEISVMNTIVHEILHACPGGHTHKGKWKEYARKVMAKHPELKIERCTASSEFNLEPYKERVKKAEKSYCLRCDECGHEYIRTRMSKAVKHPEWHRCGCCGGRLTRVR